MYPLGEDQSGPSTPDVAIAAPAPVPEIPALARLLRPIFHTPNALQRRYTTLTLRSSRKCRQQSNASRPPAEARANKWIDVNMLALASIKTSIFAGEKRRADTAPGMRLPRKTCTTVTTDRRR